MSLNRLKLGMRKKELGKPLGSHTHASQKGRETPIQLIQKVIKSDNVQKQLKENHNPQFKVNQVIIPHQKEINCQSKEQITKTIQKQHEQIDNKDLGELEQIEQQRNCNQKQQILVSSQQIISKQQQQQIQVEQIQNLEENLKETQTFSTPSNHQNQTKSVKQNVQISSDSFKIFIQQNTKLTRDVEQKRKQIDQLLFQNKKMEIQLMNTNQAYYEKQFKRLKNQVQKLQESNEEYKHQYFINTNNKKQLQANLNSKTQQVNLLLKQLEKQKIQNTQLNHQISQKDKIYKKIINELENSQTDLSLKFEDFNKKYHQADGLHKQKQVQLDSIQVRYQSTCKTLQQTQRKLKINKQAYQNQLIRIKSTMSQLQLQKRNLQRQSQAAIQRLSEDLRIVSEERQSFYLSNNQRSSQIQNENEKVCFQIQIVRLQEQLKQANQDEKIGKKTILQLTQKLKNFVSKSEYQNLEKQYKNLNQKRIDAAKFYQNKLALIQKQNQQLTIKLKPENNLVSETPTNKKNQAVHFHEALKSQIQDKDKLKTQLLKKAQQVYAIKQSLGEMTQKYQQIKMDLQISSKHQKAQDQNKKIEKQISQQNLQNEIDSLKRKFSTLQKKLQSKVRQNKQKDDFIKNYIIGKSHQGTYLVKQLERIFLSVQRTTEKL